MALSILENIPLRNLTTFKVGGLARFFCEAVSEEDLCEAIDFSKNKKIPFFILGGGSNILVADEGFTGLVIKIAIKTMYIDDIHDAKGTVEVMVGAGENWDNFVARMNIAGLYGAENLSGIPGTVGAAPVQNIGAYGVEVKSIIQSVRVFDTKENVFEELSNAECKFEYRDSIFKKESGRYVVTSVIFAMNKDGAPNISYKDLQDYFADKKTVDENFIPTIGDVRAAVLDIRSRKLPNVFQADAVGTAGSYFKNPIISAEHYFELKKKYPEMPSYPAPSPAGKESQSFVKVPLAWILDRVCGFKGTTKGNVGTYANQALVIVNTGKATAKEIKAFANVMTAAVKEKANIYIEPEVQYVG